MKAGSIWKSPEQRESSSLNMMASKLVQSVRGKGYEAREEEEEERGGRQKRGVRAHGRNSKVIEEYSWGKGSP